MADTTIPSSRNALVEFYRLRGDDWVAHAAALGLTVEAAEQVRAAALDAQAKIAEAERLRMFAKVATETANQAARQLRAIGGPATAMIRAHAESTGNIQLYDLAKVSPVAPPSPTPAPTPPTDVRAQPTANGAIILTWRGTIARSQWFIIERSVDGGDFTQQDTTRRKRWTDEKVPTGARRINYRIYAKRGDRRSTLAAETVVSFGRRPRETEMVRSRAA